MEVVITLAAPSLAEAAARDRTLAAATSARGRLDLRAPASVSYVRRLASAQRALAARIATAIPRATTRWRYSTVIDGMAVVVPRADLARLAAVPGVARVWPSFRYQPLLDRTPKLIGAPSLWGPDFSTTGSGIKIAIIDDGLDQTHPFFDPTGFKYPVGFPKGDTDFTTPKVIVARAFAPPASTWKYAQQPFDPELSDHATHVAGIAAGDRGVRATGARIVSGIAPGAYLGNYKALTTPTQQFGLDGNSPEIAAAIEAAVQDGMDVINLSLGEPEIEPGRDIVVKALNAAADAGVVPVVAAGNDFMEFGRGSITSPANAAKVITAAASTAGHDGPADTIAGFSSSGPTPLSLAMKPDVTAPGTAILSSVPKREGLWSEFDGTSMASPHVAGSAAILRQRHPTWTVAEIKSALASTGDPVYADTNHTIEAAATREGGGRIDLVQADRPLVFVDPVGLSLGEVARDATAAGTLSLTDAGGGAGAWTVAVALQTAAPGITVTVPPTVTVPGPLAVAVRVAAAAPERDVTGFVVLTRGTDRRRVPFWLRVAAPALAGSPRTALHRPGTYSGNTAGKPARVSSYRYPDAPAGIVAHLAGPEQVFRITIGRPVANFGAALVSEAPGVAVYPRLVLAGSEDRLMGYAGLPLNLNPYQEIYGKREPIVGAIAPAPAAYDLVFDTASRAGAGRFSFRFWVDDTTPPSVRLLSSRARPGGSLALLLSDAGSGVDPASLSATVDGSPRSVRYAADRAVVSLGDTAPGSHALVFRVSDRQEAKNMENVGAVLPNTRTLRTSVTVG